MVLGGKVPDFFLRGLGEPWRGAIWLCSRRASGKGHIGVSLDLEIQSGLSSSEKMEQMVGGVRVGL